MTDTGPPYPRPLGAGSNAIGEFIIGQSQIGDIPILDLWDTVLSQYANSPILIGLIQAWFADIDQTVNFEDFYDDIWNVYTAQGYGLDVWGRIVGITRVLTLTLGGYFGFGESGTAAGFGESGTGGRFYNGDTQTTNYALNDQDFRRLILAKAAANITDDSIPAINKILLMLFPNRGGNAWVSDNPTTRYFGFGESGTAAGFGESGTGADFYAGETMPKMTMAYNFNFPLTPVDYGIINSGVLPKPVGVSATINTV